METNIDTNGDGVSATLAQGAEVCNIGRFVYQIENEWIHQPTVTTCPVGTTDEYHIDATQGQSRVVATDQNTGDQLFGQNTGTLCIDFSSFPTLPFPFTASGKSTTIGGTGKYTGATGSADFKVVGSYLQFGFKGGTGAFGGFGQDTWISDGTLTLPKGGNDKED